jgi:SAM-dependent methyltransferase
MWTYRFLIASVRDLGVKATLAQLPAVALAPLTLRRLKRRKLAELSRDGFDAAHGTDTAAVLAGRELGPVVTRGGHLVVHYETTSEAAIRLPLDSLGVDLSRFTFVDLGCGKGKPLLVAATYPFRRLVGVDISPACVAVARRNVARYGPEPVDPARIEIVLGDAQDLVFPPEPLVVYLFNPFPGAVLERVVARLEASLRERPRPCALIYVNPHALAAVTACRSFERLATIADRMPAAAQGSAPHERASVFVTRGWQGREGSGVGARAVSLPGAPGGS